MAEAILKRYHKIKTGRKEGKEERCEGREKNWRLAAAVEEQEELNILTSFYLAEYDVDYTANHDQGIEDVPGVPDIALIVAACTASRRRGEGRRGREGGMQGSIRGREVTVRSNGR